MKTALNLNAVAARIRRHVRIVGLERMMQVCSLVNKHKL
jgi:hypothetical protein